MDTMPVIKIEMAGTVTSFRYPHFTQGMHPTFEMPPPSTIYGHLCSAVGDWVAPEGLRFAYRFTHEGKFVDYKEHLHFSDPIQPFPFDRELLFNPHLTLYINHLELLDALHTPHYPVVLGRSQDLMTYLSVEVVELQRATEGYFDHTLLPLEMAPRLDRGVIAVTMARFIDRQRRPQWGTYALLAETAIWPPPKPEVDDWFTEDADVSSNDWQFEGDDTRFELWIDPDKNATHPKFPHLQRLIWFHSFVED